MEITLNAVLSLRCIIGALKSCIPFGFNSNIKWKIILPSPLSQKDKNPMIDVGVRSIINRCE